ncbi:sugar transferase [Aromatoleum anaerobium]|uniref:alpha-1,3-mannosyl-glycoprotein 2-beta-N-acetylglucosaminyltransferase n=1 Tax=Aromatoleum anaerobium TaxID=182180 RepID=A0ABX1PNX2_9RHOO|nr:sugar transferase [Aromatoleum anaerobium]MCK0505740.1 hypothetical protein [Aromatoleum anaerobium]
MPNNHSLDLAPIVLFVFVRADHAKKTLEALAGNDLAAESDLIVYSDGARNDKEETAVNEVRALVKSARGFRSVLIVERQTNYGLARNIIEGVTDVCNRYGRVIVLEDDLVTSPTFLSFMNAALDRHKADKQVWHISGWNYPVDPAGLGDAFFLRVMNCWGWATWGDRWKHFEKNTDKLIAEFDRKMIRKFDLEDSGVFWSQILLNQQGRINTWAIYWYATIFKNGGLCLNPAISYVDNIGHDGSGTHGSKAAQVYSTGLNKNSYPHFSGHIIENSVAIQQIIQFYENIKPTLAQRIRSKIFSILRRMGL